jgi:hypothetical protein
MNKAFKRLEEKFVRFGATFEQDDTVLWVYLNSPHHVFQSNSKSFLITQYANLFGQSWLPKAIKELDRDLSLGIRTSTNEEFEEYCRNNPPDSACQSAS